MTAEALGASAFGVDTPFSSGSNGVKTMRDGREADLDRSVRTTQHTACDRSSRKPLRCPPLPREATPKGRATRERIVAAAPI